jgi:hypothetical protein
MTEINLDYDKIENKIEELKVKEQELRFLIIHLEDLMSDDINEDNKHLVKKYTKVEK